MAVAGNYYPMQVVIVESPAKAKTINKYLGSDYKVLASYGHIRDLPSKDGSVDPENKFAMIWQTDSQSKKRVKEIVDLVRDSDGVILATDPDREGEAISWHLLEVLRDKKVLNGKPVKRVAFNAITKTAILEAMANPRDVDQDLVDAYLARRALDYLVGFTLSPVLWRKLPGSRSAGRVQSVALRLICEREMDIEKFINEEYWTLEATASADGSQPFTARLVKLGGEKLTKFSLANEANALEAKQTVDNATFRIADVQAKPTQRKPSPPFTTSTMQQEASRKLGFNARRTMQTAQRLYEAGHITYMRTDGIDMAPEAISEARETITTSFGGDYVPSAPRVYKSKVKNAQEAHECVRPTNFNKEPKSLSLEEDQRKLYDLIWKRAISSQMENARLESTVIDILSSDDKTGLRATGSVITFDGFLKLYTESKDDSDDDEKSARLPKVSAGAATQISDAKTDQHFTQPPPRFTEASLVKRLEELGIGRPSTYASIISVLQDRTYVTMDKNRFIPDDKGRIVVAFLENFFERYVEYDFTANLEQTLDKISAGKQDWQEFLASFWKDFSAKVDGTKELRITQVLDALNESLGAHIFPDKGDGSDPRQCPTCEEGRLSLKIGRFGAFIGCERYPDCKHTKQLSKNGANDLEGGDKILGIDPDSSLEVHLKGGRFGPYVQLGDEDKENDIKPKRGSIPKGWNPNDVDLKKALMLLTLPRIIGAHPEDGENIDAAIGRFGPYVKHGKIYANLPNVEEVWEIGLNRAVTLIEEKRANPGRGRGQAATPVRDLGKHPDTDEPVGVFEGRYGPYVKHMKTNATLPNTMEVERITLDEAVELIAVRDAKGPKKKKKATKKKAKKKKAKKKTTKKKAAKKKAKTTTAAE